jgi:class 3 adenylate cyclase
MTSSGVNDSGSGKETKPTSTRRRSLRAVFAADVAGFSGRMSLNETLTVSAINEIQALGRVELDKHDGWLFGMAGDGLFATFESAVSAVSCALELQRGLKERPHLADMPLRIGIHLGEVLIDNDIPYGETLNIAARLEALAEPGGILVSGPVMDAVASRISATFEDRGVPHLKNIPRRIPTFAVSPPPERSSSDETLAGMSSLDSTTRVDRAALRDIMDMREADNQRSGAGNDLPDPPQAATPPAKPADHLPLDQIARAAAKADATTHERREELSQSAPPETRETYSEELLASLTQALAVHVGPLAKYMVEREAQRSSGFFDLVSNLEQHIPTENERVAFRLTASTINMSSADTSET